MPDRLPPSEPRPSPDRERHGEPEACGASATPKHMDGVKQSFSRAGLHERSLDEGKAVIKDFGEKGFLLRRLIGPFLLDREERAYARLSGLEGIPRWFRRMDRTSLAIEKIDGEVLGRECARRHGPVLVDRLTETVDEMHRRGVVHLDLHQRRNILVTPDGKPILIDFATSVRFNEPGDRRPSMPQRLLERIDRAAILKFRARYFEDTLAPEERSRVRRSRALSRFWISRPLNAVKKRFTRRRRARRSTRDATRVPGDRS